MNSLEPPAKGGASLEDRLIRYMEEVTPASSVELRPDTALFATGLFDSLALVHVVIWAEAEIGAPIDPGAVDFLKEWPTIADVARFIERHQKLQMALPKPSTPPTRDL